MTPTHHRRPALSQVPTTQDSAAEDGGGEHDYRAQTLIQRWTPEHQNLGALLWLTAEQARPLLELVPDTAIWDPLTRWAYQLVRRVVDTGEDPNPVTVLAAGQRHHAGDAIDPDGAPSGHQRAQLALHLFDAYSGVVAPRSCARTYATEVLDEAYRRTFDTCGIRMRQLAATTNDRDGLTRAFTAIGAELGDLGRRADRAAKQLRNKH